MSEMKWAIITGADGGMGTEITRAVAKAGYRIIMACYNPKKAEIVREHLSKETGNPYLEVIAIDLSSMQSVVSFANQILERNLSIALLMNNAGTMETGFHTTSDGFERTVSVNYMGPYLLTRKLVPLMVRGARIVNMVSCTYAIGKLDFPDFFHRGKTGSFGEFLFTVTPNWLCYYLLSNSPGNFVRKESPSMLPIRELFLPISLRCISGLIR